jgi:hypothetical protein
MPISVFGATGREYHYNPIDPTNIDVLGLGGAGMNFLFTRSQSSNHHDIVFAGETASLSAMMTQTQLWQIAKLQYGATSLFGRVNGSDDRRRQERDDLVAAYKPPMNAVDLG